MHQQTKKLNVKRLMTGPEGLTSLTFCNAVHARSEILAGNSFIVRCHVTSKFFRGRSAGSFAEQRLVIEPTRAVGKKFLAI